MKTYKIINAESEFDEDGPHEVYDHYYALVNREDKKAMTELAEGLSIDFDGTYVVRDA